MSDHRPKHWFLPETPDLPGLLRAQVEVTLGGVRSFAAWAAGDHPAGDAVMEAGVAGDRTGRELLRALRAAFVTPVEPEDLFALSRALDWILNYSGDFVQEAEAFGAEPDKAIDAMARALLDAMVHLAASISALVDDPDRATAEADLAIAAERRLADAYRQGMADQLELHPRAERIERRELYRRLSRIGEVVIDAAERVVYAVVKEP